MENKEYKNLIIFCLVVAIIIGLLPIFTNGKGVLVFEPEDWGYSILSFLLSFLMFFALGVFFISEMNDIERIDKQNNL